MSDILDYIRSKLSAQPLTPESLQAVLLDARVEYGGDAAYVRRPKVRDFMQMRAPVQSRRVGRGKPI